MYNILLTLLIVAHAIYACTLTMTNQTNLNLQMQKLSIVDEDFIDNCNYLETDNDLDHTLGVSDDHNIKQTEYQGSNWEPTDSDTRDYSKKSKQES